MRPTFYLTAAIDYPMGSPHLGNALEKIGADVQARYRRMQGWDTRLLLGSDEHTVLVPRYASVANTPVHEFIEQRAAAMRSAWTGLHVKADDFIRTSEARHKHGCRVFMQRLFDRGFIYRKRHEALYCENCEEFKQTSDLRDGFCRNHPTVRAGVIREENYFFRLASFRERLLVLYRNQPDFLRPVPVQANIVATISARLDDIAVTRERLEWGIPAPFDSSQTIYVWVDALLSYLTAVGYGNDTALFKKWWPADLQVIGKDIAWFHGVLWPALLLAAAEDLPRHIEVHGTMSHRGERMSKTMGNVVDALDLADRYGVDAVRFFLMRRCPFHSDGDFTYEDFADVHRRELVGQIGVLYDTALALCGQAVGQKTGADRNRPAVLDHATLTALVRDVHSSLQQCEYHSALAALFERVVTPLTLYCDDVSRSADAERSAGLAHELIEGLRVIAIVIKPFMPATSAKIYQTFAYDAAFEDLRLEDAATPAVRVSGAPARTAPARNPVTPLFGRTHNTPIPR